MKRLTVIVVLALVAAACSSSSDSDVAEGLTTSSASSETSSTTTAGSADASSTTATIAAVTTTSAAAATDVTSCIVGEWEMDSQQFFDDVFASLSDEEQLGEFTYASGAYVLLIGNDGSFSSERRDWSFQVTSDVGDLQMTVSGAETGTYTLDGNLLSTVSGTSEPLEVSMVVDGVPFELPAGIAPVTPPNADFSGATVTCEGDVLTASAEGFQSIWYRTG